MINSTNYHISPGQTGQRLVLERPWDGSIARFLDLRQIDELELHYWPKESLEFLNLFKEIKGLQIAVADVDPTPIMGLRELRWLSLLNLTSYSFDFNAFQNLEECAVNWFPQASSLFNRNSLTSLLIEGLPSQQISSLDKLKQLKSLSLIICRARSLDVLRSLSSLEHLRLNQMKRLESNSFLQHLHFLKTLWIQDCSSFDSLDSLSNLHQLEEVSIDVDYPIETIAPLCDLMGLKKVVLMGRNMRVVDLQLSAMLRLPKISYLSIAGPGGCHLTTRSEIEAEIDRRLSL